MTMSAVHAFDGCYEAQRAAALSGIPKSTVYDWARKEIVVPSISREREMLWSYADLMALRIVSWLRHPKVLDEGSRPAAAMHHVRAALDELDRRSLDLWDGRTGTSPLVVDGGGKIIIVEGDVTSDVGGQLLAGTLLDVLGPFDSGDGTSGPDLRRPREHLRIVPGKCAGEPHLEGSRVTTTGIAALVERGFGLDDIARLYPDETRVSLSEAIELEHALGTVDVAA
jgi:uncharacterized protein (DUF433 family)